MKVNLDNKKNKFENNSDDNIYSKVKKPKKHINKIDKIESKIDQLESLIKDIIIDIDKLKTT